MRGFDPQFTNLPDYILKCTAMIWEGREISALDWLYDRACQLYLPGGVETYSCDAAKSFWLGLRSAFPSAEFAIDHQIGRDGDMMSPRSAIRWSLTGLHEGWGAFGPPSGVPVHVMGVSYAEFGPWGLRRETSLFDEIAIWKQILPQTKKQD